MPTPQIGKQNDHMETDELAGRSARVTAPIAGGHIGEVSVTLGNQTRVYTASAADGETFALHDRVVIVRRLDGRHVLVTGY